MYTSDVTDSGFSAELMHVLEPGSVVSGIVGLDTREFPFEGKVVWARAGDSRLGQRGRMGIRFESIDGGFGAAWLQAFVAK